jgi:hypothetical protein
MKTKCASISLLNDQARGSLFQKIFIASIIVALLIAFLPAASAFAAPADDPVPGGTLEWEWANKQSMIRYHNLFYAQVTLFPVDYENKADNMARPYELLHKYGLALKQANDIILKHAGFDETGDVIDEDLALESVHHLGENLHAMRGFLAKFEEEGYDLHRLK